MYQHAGRNRSNQKIREFTVPQPQVPSALAFHANPVLHQQTAIHSFHRFHASSIARPWTIDLRFTR
jgi:hypothetical protein